MQTRIGKEYGAFYGRGNKQVAAALQYARPRRRRRYALNEPLDIALILDGQTPETRTRWKARNALRMALEIIARMRTNRMTPNATVQAKSRTVVEPLKCDY